jgi:plastocyanin domain-containing protein
MRLVLLIALLSLAACANEPKSSGAATVPAAETTTSPTQPSNIRTVDIKISGGEYIPAAVTVAPGQPVRLNFTRDEKPTCGDTVVFPDLNIRKDVPVNQVVSVDLTPSQAGNVRFTCGMNMMQGNIVVQ